MGTGRMLMIGVAAVFALQGVNLHAQKSTLPQGRPFQSLEQSLSDLERSLRQQIQNLQTQLDANTANDAVQMQLIAALQTLTSQLENSLSSTQAGLSQLTEYCALQDQLLQLQMAHVATLQSQLNAGGNLTQLYELYSAQQSVITTLTNQVNFLSTQGGAQQSRLDSLEALLGSLNADYQLTRTRLQTGCPADSSIRQLTTSSVVCEADNGGGSGILQVNEFVGTTVTVVPDTIGTADAYCPTSTPPYVAVGGGVSSTLAFSLVQSVRLPNNGWRVMVRNPNALNNLQVAARVSCLRLN